MTILAVSRTVNMRTDTEGIEFARRAVYRLQMAVPTSFSEIIELWPKAGDLGDDIGVTPIVVRAWKWRGIPGLYWADVARAAKRRGFHAVTLERLAKLGSRPRMMAAE